MVNSAKLESGTIKFKNYFKQIAVNLANQLLFIEEKTWSIDLLK